MADDTPRVTSLGGVFFKCKDPAKLRDWYKANLGINTNKYGSVFEWRQAGDSSQKGFTQWSPFSEKTKYFEPSEKDFMINYRVVNLEAMVAKLKAGGVTVTDEIETTGYGKFVHIMDLDGNKIELWEPNDAEYEKMGKSMGLETTK
ncbi:MAG: VOC family protein [Flavobacterium sp.]|nr:MAG: VOC family protein [Flavobacterium sp.]